MEIDLIEPETSAALTLPQRAAVALGSDKARTELAALVKKSAAIKEVKNAAGRDECHGAYMALVKARTSIEKIGKSARDDATKFSKAVIAEEKELIGITQPEETRLQALRDAWDEARAAEKAEAERIERERVAAIGLRIADIRECAVLASQCRTAAEVWTLIEKLAGDKLEGFEEFADEAKAVRDTAIERMTAIHAAKLAEEAEAVREKAEREAEAKRLAEERAQLAKERAEQAEATRKAQAEAAAAQKVLDDQRKAQEAELQRQRAELAAAAHLIQQQQEQLQRDQEAARQAEADRIAAEEAAAIRAIADPDPIFNQEDGGELLDGLHVTHQDLDGPSDGEIIAVAVTAVAAAFSCTTDAALSRLAEIQEWIAVELAN